MGQTVTEQRWAENEVVFRQANERVMKDLAALKEAAEAEGHEALVRDIDIPLHFHCECSDENCHQRIVLKPSEYKAVRQNSSQFVLIPGHEVPKIERVVLDEPDHIVVEKFVTPPTDVNTLKPKAVDNS